MPEPIAELEDDTPDAIDRPDRHEARFAFWQVLLAHANEQSDLHARISASRYHWLGTLMVGTQMRGCAGS